MSLADVLSSKILFFGPKMTLCDFYSIKINIIFEMEASAIKKKNHTE